MILLFWKILNFFQKMCWLFALQGVLYKGTKRLERWLSWSKAHDWKSCVGYKPTEGSNPSLSATNPWGNSSGVIFLLSIKNIPTKQKGGFPAQKVTFYLYSWAISTLPHAKFLLLFDNPFFVHIANAQKFEGSYPGDSFHQQAGYYQWHEPHGHPLSSCGKAGEFHFDWAIPLLAPQGWYQNPPTTVFG